jgi:CBS-domain-containing membrane protein
MAKPIPVSRSMSRHVISVSPRVTIGEAQEVMCRCRVQHLVVKRRGRLAGVLCVCDLELAPDGVSVERAMASPPLTVLPSTPAAVAAALMAEAGVGCLPVVSRNRVVGILTRSDLCHAPGGAEAPACVSCGARRHLHADPRNTGVLYCAECLLLSVDPKDDDETGVGD